MPASVKAARGSLRPRRCAFVQLPRESPRGVSNIIARIRINPASIISSISRKAVAAVQGLASTSRHLRP
jgi:hypothetical protein